MAEKRFEQQAKEMLENFEITPTPAAWQHIRKEIKPEERKRRFAFWWLLPVLLAGGGAIYFASTLNKRYGAVTETQKNEAKAENLKDKSLAHSEEKQQPENNIQSDNPVVDKEPNEKIASVADAKTRNHLTNKIINNNRSVFVSRKDEKEETQIKTSIADDVPFYTAKANDNNKSIAEIKETTQMVEQKSQATESDEVKLIVKQDSSSAETVPVVKVQEKKNHKWLFGASIEGGISSKAGNLSSAKTYGAVPNSLPTTGLSNNSNMRVSNTYTSGGMLGVGATAQKKLSKVVIFNAALGYQFQSYTQTQRGNRDTVINSVYISNELYNSESHVKLHALNAYTGFGFKVISSKATNLRVTTGLDNLFLVAVKEKLNVQTRTVTSTLTEKNMNSSLASFNKWQPHLRAGLTLELQQNKNVIQLSPFIRYSLKDLEKTSSGKSRLFSAGLTATYFFGR